MLEPISKHEVLERVMHIYALYRDTADPSTRNSPEHSIRLKFLRDAIDNLHHPRSRFAPRMLARLSHHAGLTIGGAFMLAGYPLDKMREVEFLLNGQRTRIVESYPFYRDREIDLPRILSDRDLSRTTFISDIVLDWQELPMRSLRGAAWCQGKFFYVQKGAEDGMALAGLPPGALLSIEAIPDKEQRDPDPSTLYCLQFTNGYRCSRCVISEGKLVLIPYDSLYPGPYEYFFPQDARIVGRARSFAVALPAAPVTVSDVPQSSVRAPLVLPWEQPTLSSLWSTERMRFGFTEKMLRRANDIFNSSLGITLSARTLRRYQREAEMVPHTEMLIALTLFHMTRFSDVFRLLGLWRDDSDRFSLDTWIKAEHLRDVQLSPRGAERPEPYSRWESIVGNWGEWPALLSMAFPRMREFQNRLLHVDQIELFSGLTPLIRPGAIALIEETEGFSNIQAGRALSEWERPIYAIRYKERIFCGYLDSDGEHIALIPHPRSNARRVSFLRHQVEMVGKWIAVASLLPGASGSLSPMPHPPKGA